MNITKVKIQLKHKALIKDLEMQIDYLVGYSNQGLHWKREYYFREELINETLSNEHTPVETVDKINNILEKLYELRQEKQTDKDQPYLKEAERLIDLKKPKHKVKVNYFQGNTSYFIEI